MYCKKLSLIFNNKQKSIETQLISKLDKFIKFNTTTSERKNINPISFSRKMNVDSSATEHLFQTATEEKLLKKLLIFNDPSNEQHKIDDIFEPVTNEEGETFFPEDYEERITTYYKLMESPENCDSGSYDFLFEGSNNDYDKEYEDYI